LFISARKNTDNNVLSVPVKLRTTTLSKLKEYNESLNSELLSEKHIFGILLSKDICIFVTRVSLSNNKKILVENK
jgi:hypothetical protein